MKLSLPSFDNAQVLVVGDIMLDRYFHGYLSIDRSGDSIAFSTKKQMIY